MKSLKIVFICILCVIYTSCSHIPNLGSTTFLYNKYDHTLLILNGDSGYHFSKIKLDLHKDTLVVNVYKKSVFMASHSVLNGALTSWKIHLKPNTGFVRSGKMLKSLSELRTYPTEIVVGFPPPVIEVSPYKYPYVCR
jgi:hypothetical protein